VQEENSMWKPALILVAAVTLSSAQNLEHHDYKLTVDVELVQLPVSVIDKHGLAVRGLQQESFKVYEDKILQNISLFKQEDAPLSVALVIDVSGSMLEKLNRLKAAVTTFMLASNPQDETAIVTFGEEVFLEQDLNGDTANLNRAFTDLPSNRGTAFYDAVYLAARYLQHSGFYEKKVLLVVSDGEDNKSKYDLRQVLKAVGESKIIVYTVGLLSSDSFPYGVNGTTPKKSLQQLAEVTGGAFFFPKSVNQVEEICTRIARDLRNQYTIGYRPSNPNLDGSWRKIVVRLDPPKNTPSVKVRTKQGYYAPVIKREPVAGSLK
jgi:Ca-activated chloride channel family protein